MQCSLDEVKCTGALTDESGIRVISTSSVVWMILASPAFEGIAFYKSSPGLGSWDRCRSRS